MIKFLQNYGHSDSNAITFQYQLIWLLKTHQSTLKVLHLSFDIIQWIHGQINENNFPVNWGKIKGVQRISWFLITNNIRVEGYSSPCTILDIQQLHIKHLKLLCTKKRWWTHLRKPPFVSVFIQIGAKTNCSSCQLVQVSSVQFSELGIQWPNYNQDT
jgi:hypothetical protein